jgi:hypothetical protein
MPAPALGWTCAFAHRGGLGRARRPSASWRALTGEQPRRGRRRGRRDAADRRRRRRARRRQPARRRRRRRRQLQLRLAHGQRARLGARGRLGDGARRGPGRRELSVVRTYRWRLGLRQWTLQDEAPRRRPSRSRRRSTFAPLNRSSASASCSRNRPAAPRSRADGPRHRALVAAPPRRGARGAVTCQQDEPRTAVLHGEFTRARDADLLGRPGDELPVGEDGLRPELAQWEIRTVLLKR